MDFFRPVLQKIKRVLQIFGRWTGVALELSWSLAIGLALSLALNLVLNLALGGSAIAPSIAQSPEPAISPTTASSPGLTGSQLQGSSPSPQPNPSPGSNLPSPNPSPTPNPSPSQTPAASNSKTDAKADVKADAKATDSKATDSKAIAKPKRAPVAIFNRRLFWVAEVGESSAARRASEISQKLESAVQNAPLARIEVRAEDGSPTLWLIQGNTEQYLMTVTQADAELDIPQKRAEAWAAATRSGLQDMHLELQSSTQGKLTSALGVVVLALALQLGLLRLWYLLRQRLTQMTVTAPTGDAEQSSDHPSRLLNFALKVCLALMLAGLWISALLGAANFFPQTRALSNQLGDNILGALTQPLIPVGDGFSIASFVVLAGLLTALVIGAGVLTDLLRSRFLSALGISTGIQEAIVVVFKYGFITLGIIILLQIWGIDLSSLAILASALGVGIGFGFQDIAKNLGSGLVLVFERPIQVGDFVEVGGYAGTIEKLGARSIRIRTLSDLTVFVPNSRFLEKEVTNWSHQQNPASIKLPVSVAHGSDLEVVKVALLEATEGQQSILKSPKPQVFFVGFGATSLDFALLVWISRPQLQMRIKSDLNFKIDTAFRHHNIQIQPASPPPELPGQVQVRTDQAPPPEGRT